MKISAADAGTGLPAIGGYFSAGNGDITAVSAPSAADTCGESAAIGGHFSAGNGDITAVAVPSAADAGTVSAAVGNDLSAGNGDVVSALCIAAADAGTVLPAIGGQLSFSALGADGQLAPVGLFHAGVLIAAGNSVGAFHVQIDIALSLGFDCRRAAGADIGVLNGHIGGGTVIRLDGDGVVGLLPLAGDDGITVWLGRALVADILLCAAVCAFGCGDGDAALVQVILVCQHAQGQKGRNQQRRQRADHPFLHWDSTFPFL